MGPKIFERKIFESTNVLCQSVPTYYVCPHLLRLSQSNMSVLTYYVCPHLICLSPSIMSVPMCRGTLMLRSRVGGWVVGWSNLILHPTLALLKAQLGFRIQVGAECGKKEDWLAVLLAQHSFAPAFNNNHQRSHEQLLFHFNLSLG